MFKFLSSFMHQSNNPSFSSYAKKFLHLSIASISIAAMSLLIGCSSTNMRNSDSNSSLNSEGTQNFELIGQIQLPPGAKIINERTLILGAGDAWVGRITMEVGKDTNNSYQFFMDQYPKQGWSLITASRGSNSLIVFTKQDRSATIEIRDGTIAVTPTVILTVAPKSVTPSYVAPVVPASSVVPLSPVMPVKN